MAVWVLKIDLRQFVAQWRAGELSIEELARKVVAEIKGTTWRSWTADPHTWDDTVDRLLQATNDREYTAAFEYIYDLADEDRVWIECN